MQFRTSINTNEIENPSKRIDYSDKTVLIGSCFVGNIGEKLSYFKFDTLSNPYGILFNPKAIEKALLDIVYQKDYTEEDLVFENEHWHSLHHHSDFSSTNVIGMLKNMNHSIQETHQYLKETNHLIITLGTAWVYHHIPTDKLVANCHKIRQTNFIKRLLSIHEIHESLTNILDLSQKINPNIKITFTLSPIRHLKDGMLANSRSKAHLLSAIHKVVDDSKALYFPSYEIVMDDLRDYRFYTDDMLHPNETAINYIWEIFKAAWIDSSAYPIMDKVAQIQRGLKHRAFNPDSKKHKLFKEEIKNQQESLLKSHQIKF